MSDTVLIAIIAAVVVVLVVLLLRRRLAGWDASWKGFKTRLTAHPAASEPGSQADTRIAGNLQEGKAHKIDVSRAAAVTDNVQKGRGHKITVRSGNGASPAP